MANIPLWMLIIIAISVIMFFVSVLITAKKNNKGDC